MSTTSQNLIQAVFTLSISDLKYSAGYLNRNMTLDDSLVREAFKIIYKVVYGRVKKQKIDMIKPLGSRKNQDAEGTEYDIDCLFPDSLFGSSGDTYQIGRIEMEIFEKNDELYEIVNFVFLATGEIRQYRLVGGERK